MPDAAAQMRTAAGEMKIALDGYENFVHGSSVHVYRSFDDFKVLDDLGRYIVVDWEEGKKSFMWGSKALLEAFNMTQTELNAWNFKDQSAAANEYHKSVWKRVQIEKGQIQEMKTAYPKGKPVPMIQKFRPIEMQLAGWPEQRTVMLMEAAPAGVPSEDPKGKDAPTQEESSQQDQTCSFATELLRYSKVITMVFDSKTETREYANQSCELFYAALEAGPEQKTPGGGGGRGGGGGGGGGGKKQQLLSDLFETCLFDNEEAKRTLLQQVRALSITSPRLECECMKIAPGGRLDTQGGRLETETGDSDKVTWHKIHFISCVNPATGQVQAELLVAASQSQEQFFAAISHELRTPLNGIIGLSESLAQNARCDERMVKTLQLIKISGLRLAGLVNDILDAASAKRGAFTIKHEMVELCEISQSVCDVLSPLVPKSKELQLVNTIPASLPRIEGDAGRINQILTNLVSNSIKFTERGSITLSASLHNDAEVLVEVTDTGIGIPHSKLDQVWAPFKQVDMSTTRKYGGTGLGLSLVKELVEAHGGRAGVRSQHHGDKTGTTFYFVLPIKQGMERREAGAKGGEGAGGERGREEASPRRGGMSGEREERVSWRTRRNEERGRSGRGGVVRASSSEAGISGSSRQPPPAPTRVRASSQEPSVRATGEETGKEGDKVGFGRTESHIRRRSTGSALDSEVTAAPLGFEAWLAAQAD